MTHTQPSEPDTFTLEFARSRVGEVLSLLKAIDQGELFAQLPAGGTARELHRTGVSLLAIAERELAKVHAAIETAELVQ